MQNDWRKYMENQNQEPQSSTDVVEEVAEDITPDRIELLKAMSGEIRQSLHEKARLAINDAIASVLAQGDLVILSVLGIDGRVEMLDIFIEECESIKKEIIEDGT
jgi:predicted transcriptional regulator